MPLFFLQYALYSFCNLYSLTFFACSYADWLNSLLGVLPPAHTYEGPALNLDIVLALVLSTPETPEPLRSAVGTLNESDDPFGSYNDPRAYVIDQSVTMASTRKRGGGSAGLSVPSGKRTRKDAPSNDIYRARHQDKASRPFF